MNEKLYTSATIEEIEGEKLFVASDNVEDRMGEIIDQDGWKLENYKRNPVVQWAHNPLEPAIGTAEKVGFKTIGGKKKLVFEPKFHRKSSLSNLIADLVDEKIIRAVSVGFRPLKQIKNKFTKAELLELSFVNVGANQNALNMAMSKNYEPKVIKQVIPDADFEKLRKGAIDFKAYPKAPLETDWDGGRQVKEADLEQLKKISTWFDTESPDMKSSYKLTHHEVSGFRVVWKGVSDAMGALLGENDIPAKDVEDVYKHLARHYREFDKEPPALRDAGEIMNKYCEEKSPEDLVKDLTKTVNVFMEEMREDKKAKEKLALRNTEDFKKNIEKRFEDIELNMEGLSEGIEPGEGLEQRLKTIENHVIELSKGIRAFTIKSSSGDKGREPLHSNESKGDQNRRKAVKVLNKLTETLNKMEK